MHGAVCEHERGACGNSICLRTLFAEERSVGGGFFECDVFNDLPDSETGHVHAHGFIEGSFEERAVFGQAVDVDGEGGEVVGAP